MKLTGTVMRVRFSDENSITRDEKRVCESNYCSVKITRNQKTN